jgi:GNAT superfamily N-acetyltransferase
MLSNPFWFALRTEHAHLALGNGPVLRYPAEVIPFAGLEHYSADEVLGPRDLLAPDEKVFLAADHLPEVDGLDQISELPGLQLHFSGDLPSFGLRDRKNAGICRLIPEHAPAMVALTDIAFPGFFRKRTYELGTYFGIFRNSELVAMAGERIALPGMREISAVVLTPEHTGKGYATRLIKHILRVHSKQQLHSFLHVAAANHRAISLYRHLGFAVTTSVHFRGIQRSRV